MMSVCSDISEFLEMLKQMRFIDDKIVQSLNTTIPSESFSAKIDATTTCKDLYTKLVGIHTERQLALQQCLGVTTVKVQRLIEQKSNSPNDIQVIKLLRSEQFKLRELQTQLNVEEVIRGRSLKIFSDRCRTFYKPAENL